MSVTVLFGLLTLTPLGAGILLGIAGLFPAARRLPWPAPLALATLAGLVPLVGLLVLAPDLIPDLPLQVALLASPRGVATLPFAPVYRLDTVGMYCALGVAVLVTPLLLWISWRTAPEEGAGEAGETAEAAATQWYAEPLGRWAWPGLALTLALESAALTLCFADNISWLIFAWLVLIACAWGLGELSSEFATIDWLSLGAMALGPVAWGVIILLVAIPAKHWRILDLTGAGGFGLGHVIALGIALACAGGAYPFLAWLRRRAAFAMPAGVAAVSLAVVPAALLVGARTYSALRNAGDNWPQFSVGVPPITAGIIWTLLGAVSVFLAGLLALGRRDGRALIALLTLALSGWGLIALGIGQPISMLGLLMLLATGVIGLGAALAALVAGGALTPDLEPESAGPRILGERLRTAPLFAWGVGVASLLGTPLLAGFAAQEVISAAALPSTKLAIPLVGLAWSGDGLLALALIRVTALAFAQSPDELRELQQAADEEDEEETEDASEDSEEDEDEDAKPSSKSARRELPGLPELRGDDLPGIVMALLAIALGIAPEWLLSLGGLAATSELLHPYALAGMTQTTAGGYSFAIGGQWLPGLAIWVVITLFVVIVLLRARGVRSARPVYLAGQTQSRLRTAFAELEAIEANPSQIATLADKDPAHLDDLEELDAVDAQIGIAEPDEAWSELRSLFVSPIATPGMGWIDIDNVEEEEAGESEADEEAESVTPEELHEARTVKAGATVPARKGKEPTAAATSPVPAASKASARATAETGAKSASAGGGKAATMPARPTAARPAPTTGASAASTSKTAAKPTARPQSTPSAKPATSASTPAQPAAPARQSTPATSATPAASSARGGRPTTAPATKTSKTSGTGANSAGRTPAPPAKTTPTQPATTRQAGGKAGSGASSSSANQRQQQGQNPGQQSGQQSGQRQQSQQSQGQKSPKKANPQRGGKRS